MLDLFRYLRASDFKTYVVTGNDVDFVRAYSESLFGIPPDHVIGFSWKYRFEENNTFSSILKLSEMSNYVACPEKSRSSSLIYRLIKTEKILAPNKPLIKSPDDILAERYAKGELTREQFMLMREDLKKPS